MTRWRPHVAKQMPPLAHVLRPARTGCRQTKKTESRRATWCGACALAAARITLARQFQTSICAWASEFRDTLSDSSLSRLRSA
jgi:hypothetical protein